MINSSDSLTFIALREQIDTEESVNIFSKRRILYSQGSRNVQLKNNLTEIFDRHFNLRANGQNERRWKNKTWRLKTV